MKHLLLLIGLLVVPAAFGVWLDQPGGAPAGPSYSFTLLHKVKLSYIELPVDWFSLVQWQQTGPNPTALGNGRYSLPFKKISSDVVISPTVELLNTLAKLPPAAPATVVPPTDDRLLLRWQPGVELFDPTNGAYLLSTTQPNSMLTGKEISWPASANKQRELYPPQEIRYCVYRQQPGVHPSKQNRTRSGLGYLSVQESAAFFYPAGEIATGPDTQFQAWLCVAREVVSGDLWFWWSNS